MTSPTCFLSYSWDTPDHQRWVRDLATSLQRNGVAVHLDQWDLRPGADLQQYMESCVRVSDFVLLICTPQYSMKANLGIGGVAYEKMLVTGELFGVISTHKFVPILRKGSPNDAIPSFLKSRVFVDFRQTEAFNAAIETLLRHLFSIPLHRPPSLGPPPAFAARSSSSAPEAATPTVLLLYGGRFQFPLPSWWNDVNAKLPSKIVSNNEAFGHIRGRCDADSGTEKTWRVAQKLWAQYYERSGELPTFLAHCERSGGRLASAAKIYADLCLIAETDGEDDFSVTYNAFEAGRAYAAIGEKDRAKLWFRKAAKSTQTTKSAASHYARLSAQELETL